MKDNYVYISVKLFLKPGQTEESIQEIVQEMDYSFTHKEIVQTEIRDTLDSQIDGDAHEMPNVQEKDQQEK